MRHFVIAGILVLVVAVLTYVGLNSVGLMPVEASQQAVSIDWMWNWELVAMTFLFSLIVVPMVYSMIVFRKKKGDTTDAEHIEGNTTLEIIWTIVPLFAVVTFAYMGSYSLGQIRRVDPNAIIIKVKAQQFQWTFEYPDQGIISQDLHLPVNKQVVLQMESADVIHSFWVPEFRIKQDVVPGRITEYRITPTLIGAYKVRCAELCGASHYSMEGAVIVNSQADYDSWIQTEASKVAAAQTPEGLGQLLYVKNCRGCHSIDGSKMTGPTWLGLFGSTVKLADGSSVIADEAYIKESILSPNAKIVAGDYTSPSVMPPFTFPDKDFANIIAFMKTLK
jgi:cytochrome c oxidase subunit 2